MQPEPDTADAPAPRARIDLNDEGDVEYWAHRLGVTRAEVAAAVRRVGARAGDVAAWLARSQPPPSG